MEQHRIEAFRERISQCKDFFKHKYKFVMPIVMTIWAFLMSVMVRLIGVGFYFSLFCVMVLLHIFFSMNTCMTPRDLGLRVLPYLLPMICMIMIVLCTTSTSLQVLSGLNPTETEVVIEETEEYLGTELLSNFFEGGLQLDKMTWFSFLPLYIIGFILFAYGDLTDQHRTIQAIGGLLILTPLMAIIVIGLTTGQSFGLITEFADINAWFSSLGGVGELFVTIIGTAMDIFLVVLFFGFEHVIAERRREQ